MAANFPQWGRGSKHDVLIKRYAIALSDHYLDPSEENEKKLDNIIIEITRKNKPKKFSSGEGNVRTEHLMSFENMCAIIEENFGLRHQDMTLFQFISRIENISEKNRKQAEGLGINKQK